MLATAVFLALMFTLWVLVGVSFLNRQTPPTFSADPATLADLECARRTQVSGTGTAEITTSADVPAPAEHA